MKSRTIVTLLSVFVILFLSFSNAVADKIVIAGDKWCPYNCDHSTVNPGYMVEVAQRAFTKAGHTVDYKVVPWIRAIHEGRKGELNGIIGASVKDAPDFVFPNNELGMDYDDIFVLKEKDWTYKDISSLSSISIGIVKGYAYVDDDLNDYIKKYSKNGKRIQTAYGDKAQEMNVRLLANDRIDAVVETPAVFWYTANQLKMKNKFKSAGTISKIENIYIAFSPANAKSKEYAQILSNGIDDLRKSGELKIILKKYGLEDWK